MACSRSGPHISSDGCSPAQKAGRSGWPKILQRWRSSSCTQRAPAGLPAGIPGIGLVIDGAVQQAPQSDRQDGRDGAGAGKTLGMMRLSAQVAGWRVAA